MYSAAVILVQYRCYSCTVPLLFLYSAAVILVQYLCYSCTVPLLFLYSTAVILVQYRCSSCTVPLLFLYSTVVILLRFEWNLNFLDRLSKNRQILNLIKICPMRAELFHADGQTDKHGEANTSFSQLCDWTEQLGDAKLNTQITFIVLATLYCCTVCGRQNCVRRSSSLCYVLKKEGNWDVFAPWC
jgi:hypothetical protein